MLAAGPEMLHKTQEAFPGRLETAAAVTGRLAHDFGNILTGILGFAELSLTHLPADATARLYVQELVHAAQDGAGWVRKLQVFSRRAKPAAQASRLAPLVARAQDKLRQIWSNLKWEPTPNRLVPNKKYYKALSL